MLAQLGGIDLRITCQYRAKLRQRVVLFRARQARDQGIDQPLTSRRIQRFQIAGCLGFLVVTILLFGTGRRSR